MELIRSLNAHEGIPGIMRQASLLGHRQSSIGSSQGAAMLQHALNHVSLSHNERLMRQISSVSLTGGGGGRRSQRASEMGSADEGSEQNVEFAAAAGPHNPQSRARSMVGANLDPIEEGDVEAPVPHWKRQQTKKTVQVQRRPPRQKTRCDLQPSLQFHALFFLTEEVRTILCQRLLLPRTP